MGGYGDKDQQLADQKYRLTGGGKTVTVGPQAAFAKIRNVKPSSYRVTIRAINGVGTGKPARTSQVRVTR